MNEFFLSLRGVWWKLKRDKGAMAGLAIVVVLILAAFASLFVASEEVVIKQNLNAVLQPPSWQHILGTDQFGRDVLLRLLYGSRISLSVGIIVVSIGMSIGIALGTSSGYFGGWWDAVVMRVTDVMLAFPFLLLAIALTVLLQPGLGSTIVALGIASFPSYTRLVRGTVLSLREETYVDAARVAGASHTRIMWSHLVPNLIGTLIVYGTLRISTAILAEAGLSYLGLSAQPPRPTWGNMLNDGRDFILFYEWLALFPGLAILFTVAGFNLLGDGLRDALDPKSRKH